VLPFLEILPEIQADKFEIVLKIHTKRSSHRKDGITWRRDLYRKLLDRDVFDRAISAFAKNPSLGIIGPDQHYVPMSTYIGSNRRNILSIGSRLGLNEKQIFGHGFFAGTMFIARIAALSPLMKLGFCSQDFEEEKGQTDGTLAHAIERGFALSAAAAETWLATTSNVCCPAKINERYNFA
jgi:lipopolysaccharide biosynthesis protein